MLLLAIDTTTSAVTIALHDGERVIAESTVLNLRAHGALVAPGIERVLADAGAGPEDVTGVVTGVGPGPFTGLRVGIVTARVFAFARGIPVHGVCSLDALAHGALLDRRQLCRAGDPSEAADPRQVPRQTAAAALGSRFVVATDARRKEVYWARYDVTDSGAVRLGEPQVAKPADLPEDVRDLTCVGRGPLLYPEAFGAAADPLDVSAGALADLAVRRLAAGDDLHDTEPLYLRRPDAVPPPPRQAARQQAGRTSR